jgi:hypothetical protein
VLATAHKERLVEYDRAAARVHITPLGTALVEKKLAVHLIA